MLTPVEITERMNQHLPENSPLYPPSAEQEPVVMASIEHPTLVVAGAGSGKTETMANRMLWLVANGFVTPERVLGLTFTRKAAGELSHRFVERLHTLERAGIAGLGEDRMPPTVSTYNSFANEVFREFAYLIGRSPDAEVLTETAARVLAREVVLASSDERLAAFGRVDTVVKALVELSAQMGDNLLSTDDLRAYPGEFIGVLEQTLLRESKNAKAVAATEGLVENAEKFESLLDLVDVFEQRKRERGVVTFSDQVRLALEVIERVPSVRHELRSRFGVILLDEYQDTSVMQVRLLSALFSECGVMAVGDPNQSIYGWRGAAAGTLERFLSDFGGEQEHRFALSTSWRNDREILVAANRLAGTGNEVLELRPSARAGEGTVQRRFYELLTDEAEDLAGWFAEHINEADEPPTAALLMRSRTWMRAYTKALDEHGVDFMIVGGGGLLGEPVIVDLVAIARVLGRPDDGQSLLRILASSRWRIGAADMQALVRFSKRYAEHDKAAGDMGTATSPEQLASIVDALDALERADELRISTHGFSPAGLERMRELAAELRRLRGLRNRPATELLRAIIRTTGLDVELAANEHADVRVLDAFFDEVALMQRAEGVFGLSELLAWLDVAEGEDRMELPPPEPVPGRVQVMTIHGAKGLEWDLVAIPALSNGSFPGRSKQQADGLTASTVPHRFRGDRSALPEFEVDGSFTPVEVEKALAQYKRDNEQRRLGEEQRIAYVGMTRAKHALWLSGSALAPDQVKKKTASDFLTQAGPTERVAAREPEESQEMAATVQWPPVPFGSRAEAMARARTAVESAGAIQDAALQRHVDALLIEHDVKAPAPLRRIGASRLLEWVDAPGRATAERDRPMPVRQSSSAVLGTVFHQWAEGRIAGGYDGTLSGFELDDAGASFDQLEKLQSNYLKTTRYAELEMHGGVAEQQIDLRIAGITVSCKIDAVFEVGDRVLIVDWKTGRAPTGDRLESRSRQLSLYRIAYSELTGVPLERIDAEFFFAQDAVTVALEHPLSKDELAELIAAARTED